MAERSETPMPGEVGRSIYQMDIWMGPIFKVTRRDGHDRWLDRSAARTRSRAINRRIREPDDGETGEPRRDVDLDTGRARRLHAGWRKG